MLLILLGLTILNGLFAMSEMALVSARKARLQKYIDEGDRSAIEAARLSEDPALFLSTIQVGLTSIAIVNGIIGEKALAEPVAQWLQQHLSLPESTVHGLTTFLVVAFVTYLTIVIGELVPKRLGQLNHVAIRRQPVREARALKKVSDLPPYVGGTAGVAPCPDAAFSIASNSSWLDSRNSSRTSSSKASCSSAA